MVKIFQYNPVGLKKNRIKFALARRYILELVERKERSEKLNVFAFNFYF